MNAPGNASHAGYTNEFNKPISDDVDKWFAYGVKSSGSEVKTGFCATTTTYYVLLGVVFFIVLALIIMVPVILGTINKGSSG